MRERLGEINWKLLWAVVSCIVIFIATFAVVLWLRDRDLQRVEVLATSNKQLIAQIDDLNRQQADTAYKECTARNARAKASIKAFKALVSAHRRDGNPRAAAVWQGYLDATKKTPIPPCVKPNPNETGDGIGER